MLLTFGLFETAADVRAAISDLAKAGFRPESLTLVARDHESDTAEQSDRRTTVAQVIDGLDLAPSAIYFDTLALIVIPEEGIFLMGGWPARELTRISYGEEPEQTQLGRFLMGIGCASEEANFLGSRLEAGVLLLGVEADDDERLDAAREIFTEQQAIHLGEAALPAPQEGQLPADVPIPNASVIGDAIVLDVVTLLVLGDGVPDDSKLIGRQLIDESGAEIGEITAVAVDPRHPRDLAPAYVIVQRGGFLGMGSNEYVIPAELIEAAPDGSYRASLALDALENAPAFDSRLPISRREELAICGYYGTVPYWEQQAQVGAGADV